MSIYGNKGVLWSSAGSSWCRSSISNLKQPPSPTRRWKSPSPSSEPQSSRSPSPVPSYAPPWLAPAQCGLRLPPLGSDGPSPLPVDLHSNSIYIVNYIVNCRISRSFARKTWKLHCKSHQKSGVGRTNDTRHAGRVGAQVRQGFGSCPAVEEPFYLLAGLLVPASVLHCLFLELGGKV